ncbi:MAG: hypothetical protein VCB07_11450, partial [Gammaproteobacteria bacterium]
MTPANIWKIRDVSLEQEVEALYSAELRYHNFQHAIDTIRAAEHITTTCIEEGIRVNHRVVYFALLFHDAGFREDHLALGFSTKEAYSAELAANRLGERGESQIVIEKVVAAILSTHKDASFVTVEQKAVRAADLSSLAANYDVFLKNATDLKAEYELFNDTSISWRSWVYIVRKSVQFYLAQEIRLTSYYVN